MIRKLLAVSATALMLMAGSQVASATATAPQVTGKAPVSTITADGSYKIAQNTRRARNRNRNRRGRRGNRGRNLGIGLGIAAGAIALGAAAAAARDRDEYRGRRSCRRVERRCARRHGWETRRWFNCVEDRGC
ncbi:MAG: hypothetical protein HKP56_10595 [Anderseniella sp.]|nr:hypothetical protein [Anderseniella sp.]